MRPAASRLLFWSPRALCILFALFLSIFALDVFTPGKPVGRVALELLLHLVPTFLLLLLLALSWRRELVGAIVFFGLGVLYLVGTWGRFHWSAYAAISGSLFVVAGLFFTGWMARRHGVPGQRPLIS